MVVEIVGTRVWWPIWNSGKLCKGSGGDAMGRCSSRGFRVGVAWIVVVGRILHAMDRWEKGGADLDRASMEKDGAGG